MINYGFLHASTLFYEERKFMRIEAPWTVTEEIANITKPKHLGETFYLRDKKKMLVGSAEQSFLYLACKGFLSPGSYQAITPCFREDLHGPLHSKYFMKNELIDTKTVTLSRLTEVVEMAAEFFQSMVPSAHRIEVKETTTQGDEPSFDIEYNSPLKTIELGSYGIRHTSFLSWIYGTGCAEPRLSNAILSGQQATQRYYGIPQERNTSGHCR
jgi:hypothetical protein